MNESRQRARATATCELTILLPCLNEAETLGACVRKARGYLDSRGIDGEILVADNGSTDGSPAIAKGLGATIVHVAERGYGNALSAGIAAAHGEYIIMGDADESYDFSALDVFVDKLRDGYQFVIGNRFKGGIAPGAMPFLHRYLGNPVLSAIGRLFFDCPVNDFHCGLRGFHRDAIESLGLTTTGMEFASEMVVKAVFHRLRIAEVPTTLSPDGRNRPSHLRTWRDGWRHLRFLLLFSPRWLFLYPGCLLTLVGLLSMLWLLPAPRTLGGVIFDVHTLVFSSAAIICGVQAVVFSLLATVYAVNAGLMPANPRVTRVVEVISLEEGIVVGLALLLGGVATSAYALGEWGAASFGPVDPIKAMRIVVPAVTAMAVGLQIIFTSFFLGVLRLERR